MASILEVIPAELMRPEAKTGLLAWLRASPFPSRFRRRLLQEWGEELGVAVTSADYEAVVMKIK